MDETTTYLYPLMLTSEELAEPYRRAARPKRRPSGFDGNERSMAAERNYKAIIEAEDAELD